MAPARHETPAAAGHQQGPESTKSSYGTRSKRKASEISNDSTNGTSSGPTSNGRKVSSGSSASTRTAEASEPKHPFKKARTTKSHPKTPEPQTPEEQESVSPSTPITPQNLQDIPAVTVNGPSVSDDEDIPTFQNERESLSEPREFKDDLETFDSESIIPSVAVTPRGRGGRRGGRRGGFRGRGNLAGRGGRTNGDFSVESTPVASKVLPKFTGVRGRGRGGRVKKSSIPRLQALYDRRSVLKQQFKQVAAIQKNALQTVSEMSLNAMESNPKYHETLPEYTELTERLREIYETNVAIIEKRGQLQISLCDKTLGIQNSITSKSYVDTVQNLKEDYEDLAMQHVVYLVARNIRGDPGESLELMDRKVFYHELVKEIDAPPKMLGQHAMPYSLPQPAVTSACTEGDTDYEQHPSNWWNSLSQSQRNQYQKDIEKELARKKVNLNKKRRKRRMPGSQLVAVMPAGGNQAGEQEQEDEENEEEDENDVDAAEQSGEQTPAKGSKALGKGVKKATKASKDTKDPKDQEDEEESDLADEYPEDIDGFAVPKKKNAHNKIKAPAQTEFEPHEIGKTIYKTKNFNGFNCAVSYSATNNQQEWRYFQRVSGTTNSAKLSPGDYDEEIVKQHNLHPKFGLAKRDSTNDSPTEYIEKYGKEAPSLFDPPPTNFSEPLPYTTPIGFIELVDDHPVRTFHTTRSAHLVRARDEFETIPEKQKLGGVLQSLIEIGDFVPPTPPPAPRAIVRPETPMDLTAFLELIDAASSAPEPAPVPAFVVSQSPATPTAHPARASRPPSMSQSPMFQTGTSHTPQFTQSAPIAQVNPVVQAIQANQRRGYDPVRDTMSYQTPYAQPAPIQPPPPPPVRPLAGGLSVLADAAEFRVMPLAQAFPAPRPANPYLPPQPMPSFQQYVPASQGFQIQQPYPPSQPQPQSPIGPSSMAQSPMAQHQMGQSLMGQLPMGQSLMGQSQPGQHNSQRSAAGRGSHREIRPAPPANIKNKPPTWYRGPYQ